MSVNTRQPSPLEIRRSHRSGSVASVCHGFGEWSGLRFGTTSVGNPRFDPRSGPVAVPTEGTGFSCDAAHHLRRRTRLLVRLRGFVSFQEVLARRESNSALAAWSSWEMAVIWFEIPAS
jgi:hypothetical protein